MRSFTRQMSYRCVTPVLATENLEPRIGELGLFSCPSLLYITGELAAIFKSVRIRAAETVSKV